MKETEGGGRIEPGTGERFQEETKYTPERLSGHRLDWSRIPERYKNHPDALRTVLLPQPDIAGHREDIWNTLARRRSVRNYESPRPMPLEDLALLLWATQGITATSGRFEFRTAPSAGGLYPIETYIMATNVRDIDRGIYHFRPLEFDLELLRKGDHGNVLANAALRQKIALEAQVCFIWTAVVERSMWKYRQRAFRYIYLDAGHIAQNLYLAGTAAGMGVCGIGAFFDDQVNDLVGIDGRKETALYMASVGWPAD
jgi:SagB-type dehydrogenase family enzyme